MARDFENLHDIDELDNRELRDLVREQLSQHGALDIDDITVTAQDGHVVLAGRVGTDGERRIAEHVLTDVIGVTDFSNEMSRNQFYANILNDQRMQNEVDPSTMPGSGNGG